MTAEAVDGDPRVARSRAAVLEAAVALLGEVGHRGTSIEAIAERSGVAKTTIYRHWPSRAQLLFDAFHSLADIEHPEPTGDLRADLVGQVSVLATKLRDPQWSGIMATLIDAAEADPELAELSATFSQGRQDAVRTILEGGIETGEVDPRADLRLAARLLGGAIFYQRLILRHPASAADVEGVVDLVLNALRPGQAST